MSYGPKQTLKEGFEKFVIKNSEGCWDWKGCAPKNPGYGQFRHGMKLERSHRASWIIHNGPIPSNMFVLHKCDNKRCSNPDHLFLGTNIDNVMDMLKKGYHTTLGKKGENNHMNVLTEDQVRQIRVMVNKEKSLKKIADHFNVSPGAIGGIKYNNTWKELS